MSSGRITPFSQHETTVILDAFHRDGFALVPSILDTKEVEHMRENVDRVLADTQYRTAKNVVNNLTAARLFETGEIFENMIDREPIAGLAETLLGEDCHLIAQNVIRNAPRQPTFADDFHLDLPLLFPLGPGMTRHDARLRMPVYWASIFIPLVDIPTLEFGPTQYVPGSHYAGTHPNDQQNPQFEANEPVSMFVRVGDIYLHNHQCWHRAAPNTSDRTRYLFQNTYGARWVGHWFYPYVNYQLPGGILERATERRRRLLGLFSSGPFS